MSNLPCKQCICFPICKAKRYKYDINDITDFVFKELMSCSLLSDYLYGGWPVTDVNTIQSIYDHFNRGFRFQSKDKGYV